jgi:cytochrome c1
VGTIFNLTDMFTSALEQYGNGGGVVLSVWDASWSLDGPLDLLLDWGSLTRGGLVYAERGFGSGSESKEEVRALRTAADPAVLNQD